MRNMKINMTTQENRKEVKLNKLVKAICHEKEF